MDLDPCATEDHVYSLDTNRLNLVEMYECQYFVTLFLAYHHILLCYNKIQVFMNDTINFYFILKNTMNARLRRTLIMDTGTHVVMGIALGGLATLDPVVSNDPTLFNAVRSEEHTSELQSRFDIVCRLLL